MNGKFRSSVRIGAPCVCDRLRFLFPRVQSTLGCRTLPMGLTQLHTSSEFGTLASCFRSLTSMDRGLHVVAHWKCLRRRPVHAPRARSRKSSLSYD
eukprot:4894549-Pyramimonas_sp.AAC.1